MLHAILASRVILNVRKAASFDNFQLSTKVSLSLGFNDRLAESIDLASGVIAPHADRLAEYERDEDEDDSLYREGSITSV